MSQAEKLIAELKKWNSAANQSAIRASLSTDLRNWLNCK
jgi:hypothetical protein